MKGYQDRQHEFRATYKNEKSQVNLVFWFSLIFLVISISNVSLAGSKQPKLAGGNGNSQGR